MDPNSPEALAPHLRSGTPDATTMTHWPAPAQTPEYEALQNALRYGSSFMHGGLFGAAKDAGYQTPNWANEVGNFLNSPDVQTAIGAANGVSPPWTAADEAAVVKNYKAGQSHTENAAALGRSPMAVRMKLNKMGVLDSAGQNTWADPTKVEKLVDLFSKGVPQPEIANQLGVDYKSVRNKLNRMSPNEKINNLYGKMSGAEIAQLLGMTRNQVIGRAWRASQAGKSLPNMPKGATPSLPPLNLPPTDMLTPEDYLAGLGMFKQK